MCMRTCVSYVVVAGLLVLIYRGVLIAPVKRFHHNSTGYDRIPPDIKLTCLSSLSGLRMWLKKCVRLTQ